MASDLLKKSFFLFLITLFAFCGKAQQTHFMYLQTDNGQPFYVKMNHKIISSSSEGFVILPGLADSTYQLKVGFPKNEHPEETFELKIENNNEGFVIKNFEDKGIQLFNLETLALIAGTNNNNQPKDTIAVATTEKKEPDPFTQLLANVVKDSSILENHQVVTDKPLKPADTTSVTNTDTNLVVEKRDSSASVSESSVAVAPVKPDSRTVQGNPAILKILSKENEHGLTMLYSDSSGNTKDTVNIFIPVENTALAADSSNTDSAKEELAESKNHDISSFTDSAGLTITPTVIEKDKENNSGFVMRKDSIATNTEAGVAPTQVFIIGPEKEKKNTEAKSNTDATENSAVDANPDSGKEKKAIISDIKITDKSKQRNKDEKRGTNESKIEVLPKVVTSSTVNSDCKDFATNEDFLRLRKKMASENTDEGMIKIAKRYFRSKCFSTSQIKDLSYLFLTNEGKYKFFDAAYAYTSDSDQYETLESQLTDEYYLNRFKAMLRK